MHYYKISVSDRIVININLSHKKYYLSLVLLETPWLLSGGKINYIFYSSQIRFSESDLYILEQGYDLSLSTLNKKFNFTPNYGGACL